MNLSKNALGNLINRYKAVLKRCSLMNVFGTLAVVGMLVAGSVNVAEAASWTNVNGTATEIAAPTLGTDTVDGEVKNNGSTPGQLTLTGIATGRLKSLTVTSDGTSSGTAKLIINATAFKSLETDITVAAGNAAGAEIQVSQDADLGTITLLGTNASAMAILTIDTTKTLTGTTAVGNFSNLALSGIHLGSVTLDADGGVLGDSKLTVGAGDAAKVTGNVIATKGTITITDGNLEVTGNLTVTADSAITLTGGKELAVGGIFNNAKDIAINNTATKLIIGALAGTGKVILTAGTVEFSKKVDSSNFYTTAILNHSTSTSASGLSLGVATGGATLNAGGLGLVGFGNTDATALKSGSNNSLTIKAFGIGIGNPADQADTTFIFGEVGTNTGTNSLTINSQTATNGNDNFLWSNVIVKGHGDAVGTMTLGDHVGADAVHSTTKSITLAGETDVTKAVLNVKHNTFRVDGIGVADGKFGTVAISDKATLMLGTLQH